MASGPTYKPFPRKKETTIQPGKLIRSFSWIRQNAPRDFHLWRVKRWRFCELWILQFWKPINYLIQNSKPAMWHKNRRKIRVPTSWGFGRWGFLEGMIYIIYTVYRLHKIVQGILNMYIHIHQSMYVLYLPELQPPEISWFLLYFSMHFLTGGIPWPKIKGPAWGVPNLPTNLQQDPRSTDPEKTWVSKISIATYLGGPLGSGPIQLFDGLLKPHMGVSLNGGTPNLHPQNDHF